MAIAPRSATSSASDAIRNAFKCRCSRENPKSADKFVRTTSPSKITASLPRASRYCANSEASVDFPAQGRPVNHTHKPDFMRLLAFPGRQVAVQKLRQLMDVVTVVARQVGPLISIHHSLRPFCHKMPSGHVRPKTG